MKKEQLQKQTYSLKVEVMLPADFSFKVEAENEQEALNMLSSCMKNAKFSLAPRFKINQATPRKIKVYKFGTMNLVATKKL